MASPSLTSDHEDSPTLTSNALRLTIYAEHSSAGDSRDRLLSTGLFDDVSEPFPVSLPDAQRESELPHAHVDISEPEGMGVDHPNTASHAQDPSASPATSSTPTTSSVTDSSPASPAAPPPSPDVDVNDANEGSFSCYDFDDASPEYSICVYGHDLSALDASYDPSDEVFYPSPSEDVDGLEDDQDVESEVEVEVESEGEHKDEGEDKDKDKEDEDEGEDEDEDMDMETEGEPYRSTDTEDIDTHTDFDEN